MNLRVPGPTPLPREVLEAGSKQMVNHRGPEFAALQERIFPRLKAFFQTQNDILVMTASGTGGLESAVVNTLSPGDRVLGVSIGAFGDRFASIAETYGASVNRLEFEWGTPADPDRIAGGARTQREARCRRRTRGHAAGSDAGGVPRLSISVSAAVCDRADVAGDGGTISAAARRLTDVSFRQ